MGPASRNCSGCLFNDLLWHGHSVFMPRLKRSTTIYAGWASGNPSHSSQTVLTCPRLSRNRLPTQGPCSFWPIHPKKGVDILLHAWSQVMERHTEWRLSIVGTDAAYGAKSDHLERMKTLAATLGLKRVQFSDPSYGEAKWAVYREADLFVLPTHSENFGMTVAESLAAGTPVIATKGAPWESLEAHQSGWWINVGIESLVVALENAMQHSRRELAERGENGRQWMESEFSWRSVAEKMDLTYRWLTGRGDLPAWVTTDSASGQL